MPNTAAERVADFVSSLEYTQIPEPTVRATKGHLLDTLGCGLAARGLGLAGAAFSTAAEAGGEPDATVLGSERRLPPAGAALANGALCHALDFDSTHAASVCHIGAVVHPAALAMAEAAGADGRALIEAIVAGTEVVARLGMAAPSRFHQRGFHPTSVCGVFGAAAAAARLSGLDAALVVNALGIAGSMASGVFEYLSDGSSTKLLHPAWAAHAGIVAARLALHGATGPRTVLEGRFGLYATFVGSRDTGLDGALATLGSRWESERVAYKPYPACHFLHSCLDAAAEIATEHELQATDVAEIHVAVPRDVVPIVLEPVEDKLAPRTPYDAKFSLQYSVAAMLVHGRVDVATYSEEAIEDPAVLELARRVTWEPREFPTYPAGFPGAVLIATRAGARHFAALDYQRGGPENPLSSAALLDKFHRNASLSLGDREASAVAEDVLALERVEDLAGALAPLSGGRTSEPASL